MEEIFQTLLKQMQEQQHKDNLAMQTLVSQLLSQQSVATPNLDNVKVESKSPEFIMEALASNITEFCFDIENNLTFDTWYARYEDLFEIDASKLDDAAKVRLLLRKLNSIVHSKYINYILPKHPRDHTFKETVQKLTQLFGFKTSQFNLRYNCLQLTKESHCDFITYAGIVNKHCEQFKLRDPTLDQFKCLIYVMGMKSASDFEVRTKMLTKLDSEGSTITLDILSRECQRLINLKTDTALIENVKTDAVVNRLHTTNSSSNKSKAIPKSPCWFCGNMHFARDCSYTKHKCLQCNNICHKEGYCNAGKKKKYQTHKNNRPKAKTNLNNNKTFRPELKSIFISNKIEPSQRKYVSLNINGTNIHLQLDTASEITIISEKIFKNINVPRVDKVSHTARSATGKLPLSAQFDCNVKFRTRQAYSTCYVTPIKNLNVMGLDWIKALNLEEMSISTICNQVTREAENKKKVFNDSLGLCNKTKAHLVTMPNIQPVLRPKRPVAYAVKDLVEAELQRLQDTNVISPVNYSEWAAPIVVIRKSNGSIRICADFSRKSSVPSAIARGYFRKAGQC
ncbi:uncharacterized protein K02A2.6-like [Eupeodes corollae]|uniref:uncharacterized protein K02A2.6-like n=1 Tax=Eupeodes corollae TaxID=290404 RepID=UPI00248FF72A|nr:uncharacterized protein K02A2.6-like [Eupeodes corollae]